MSYRKLLIQIILLFVICNSSVLLADSISVNIWQEFTINLNSNPTTGYQWRLVTKLPSWLEIVRHDYTPTNPEQIGGGGIEEWTFKATNIGNTTLIFCCSR
jgi:predicted secreted protein